MRRQLGIFLVVLGLTTGPVIALTDEEVFRDFRFNMINPGARSLALAGAFISLADDATAAQANPAGLSYLSTQEYFIELRGVDNGSRVANLQDSLPAGAQISVLTGSELDDAQNITFASAVFPIKKFTLGFSRQVVLNNNASTLNSFSFQFTGGNPGTSTIQASGSLDVSQTNLNASSGFRVNDRLAFGASVAFARLNVKSDVDSFIFDPSGNIAGNPILQPTLDLRTRIHDGDSAVGFTIGALIKPAEAFSVGAVYRKAPKFAVLEQIVPGGLDVFGVQAALGSNFENKFNVPDSYGVGVSWRPYKFLTVAMDIERIEYSDLVEDYVPGVNTLTGFDAKFKADDATDYRVGGEYVFQLKNGILLAPRAGVFTQSDNTVRGISTGTGTGVFATPSSFPGRDREIHGALGVGINIGRQQIDLGADLGNSVNEFLVSYIFKGK
jgi:long-chain fatty acid transport protein